MKLAIKYTIFAALATLANIGSQHVVVMLADWTYTIAVSVLIGTAVGLYVKYWLDKHYIFFFQASSKAHDARTFLVYSAMGVITTAIFWGTEFAFHVAFGTDLMRYAGAVLGLAAGYIIKYQLDKRYVFNSMEGV